MFSTSVNATAMPQQNYLQGNYADSDDEDWHTDPGDFAYDDDAYHNTEA